MRVIIASLWLCVLTLTASAQQPTATKPPFPLSLLATQNPHTFVCNPTGGTTTPQACLLASYFNWAGSTLGINTMVGDSGTGGQAGLVPAPAAGDAATKFLSASGSWVAPAGGGGGGGSIVNMTAGQLAKAQDATNINGSQAFSATPTATTIPLADSGGHLNNGWLAVIPNTSLANSSVTIAGHSVALGAPNTALAVGDLSAINNNNFVGNVSGVSAVPAALTATQVTAALNPCNATTKGMVPAPPNSTTQVLRGDCSFAAMPGGPSAANVWTGQNSEPPCPMTFNSTLASSATACAAGPTYGVGAQWVTLTGNATWQKPSGLVDGQVILYDFFQDGTGNRTLTLPGDGTILVPANVLTGANVNLTRTAQRMDRAVCSGAGGTSPSFSSTRMVCSNWVFDIGTPAISLVAHVTANGQNVASSATNTTGANLLVAVANLDHITSTAGAVMTDSAGNTWSLCGTPRDDGISKAAIYYVYAPTTSASHTFTNTTYVGILEVSAWSGAAASPCDQSNGATTSSATSLQTGSITPTQSGELVIAGFTGGEVIGTLAINSAFTLLDQLPWAFGNNWTGGAAYSIQSTASAVNPTWSWSSTDHAATVIASFK